MGPDSWSIKAVPCALLMHEQSEVTGGGAFPDPTLHWTGAPCAPGAALITCAVLVRPPRFLLEGCCSLAPNILPSLRQASHMLLFDD